MAAPTVMKHHITQMYTMVYEGYDLCKTEDEKIALYGTLNSMNDMAPNTGECKIFLRSVIEKAWEEKEKGTDIDAALEKYFDAALEKEKARREEAERELAELLKKEAELKALIAQKNMMKKTPEWKLMMNRIEKVVFDDNGELRP